MFVPAARARLSPARPTVQRKSGRIGPSWRQPDPIDENLYALNTQSRPHPSGWC